jgi:hypothetical protein
LVYLWRLNAESTDLPLRLAVKNGVNRIAFSQDSRSLIAESGYETLLWPLDREEVIQLARQTVGRELTPEERAQYQIPKKLAIVLGTD